MDTVVLYYIINALPLPSESELAYKLWVCYDVVTPWLLPASYNMTKEDIFDFEREQTAKSVECCFPSKKFVSYYFISPF